MADEKSSLILISQERQSAMEGSNHIFEMWQRGLIDCPRKFIQPFIMILSEFDHLPLKEKESLWHVDRIDEIRAEKRSLDEFYQDTFIQACEDLINFLP